MLKKLSSVPLLLYIAVVVLLHVIPIGSGVPRSRSPLFEGDYIFHLILFLPWIWMVFIRYRLLEKVDTFSRFRVFLLWTTIGLLLALAAEGVQYVIPYRVFNPIDLLYNVFGVFVGAVFYFLWRR